MSERAQEIQAEFERFWALIRPDLDLERALYDGEAVSELMKSAFAAGALGSTAMRAMCDEIEAEDAAGLDAFGPDPETGHEAGAVH